MVLILVKDDTLDLACSGSEITRRPHTPRLHRRAAAAWCCMRLSFLLASLGRCAAPRHKHNPPQQHREKGTYRAAPAGSLTLFLPSLPLILFSFLPFPNLLIYSRYILSFSITIILSLTPSFY